LGVNKQAGGLEELTVVPLVQQFKKIAGGVNNGTGSTHLGESVSVGGRGEKGGRGQLTRGDQKKKTLKRGLVEEEK